jgi:hypothetical protein
MMTRGTPIDRAKLLSLGYLRRGRTRDQVREWRTDDGERHKATTDELNNTVTQHARGDRQDVHLRPGPIRAHVSELRP